MDQDLVSVKDGETRRSVVNCTRLSFCEKSLHSFRKESLSAKHPGIRFPPHKQCETPWVCRFTSISLFRLLQKQYESPTYGFWGLGPLLIRGHRRTKKNNKNRPISKHPFSWIGSCEMPRAANQEKFGSNDMHTYTVYYSIYILTEPEW